MRPPFAAVAAMERASIRQTPANWPSPGLEPSRLGKLRVVWRMDRPLLAGTSPAPKHGPQKLGLMTAPAASRSPVAPILAPRRICAASSMLSNMPPEQPAITPWSAQTAPSWILLCRSIFALGQRFLASASTAASSSGARARNSRMGQALEGWKGRAIMGSTRLRSTWTMRS